MEVTPLPMAASVTASTRAALEEAGRLDHPAGQAALVLAARLDAGAVETGSALAALAREHGARLEAALAGTRKPESPLQSLRDELAERRVRRGA